MSQRWLVRVHLALGMKAVRAFLFGDLVDNERVTL